MAADLHDCLVPSSGPCELSNQRVSVIVACGLPIDPCRAYRRPLGRRSEVRRLGQFPI